MATTDTQAQAMKTRIALADYRATEKVLAQMELAPINRPLTLADARLVWEAASREWIATLAQEMTR